MPAPPAALPLLPLLAWMPRLPLAAPASIASTVRDAAGDVSLFLLVGGLVMLTVVCLLVFVQNLLPDRDPQGDAGDAPKAATRRLRSLEGGLLAQDLARRNGRNGRPVRRRLAPVDLAMDRVVELRLGEPRLLFSHERMSRVRLYGCRGCAYGAGATEGAPGHGCARERAALDEVFTAIYGPRVRTQESSCRRRGDAACEFEVAHA